MKERPPKSVEKCRIKAGDFASDETFGNNGAFMIPYQDKSGRNVKLSVIISDGVGWDHVSVSLKHRCPTWKEMCFIKDIFFDEEETVIQYHPPKSVYKNFHPYCLHLWRKQDVEYDLPPGWTIAP